MKLRRILSIVALAFLLMCLLFVASQKNKKDDTTEQDKLASKLYDKGDYEGSEKESRATLAL